MNINVSVGDFSPLLRHPDYLFSGLQQTGVGGIELWLGVKSRWTPNYYASLSKKYQLPIISVHQPLWAMTGKYFDDGFFTTAKQLGVQAITCHPLPGYYLGSSQMNKYFAKLAQLQTQTGIQVLIENMPPRSRSKILQLAEQREKIAAPITQVYTHATPYGLGVTLDTDHVRVAKPHQEPWFTTVLPAVRNIHLSSFTSDKQHQPLDTGHLDTAGFLHHLKQSHYNGLITLEVSAPKAITLFQYDFDRIARSVELARRYF